MFLGLVKMIGQYLSYGAVSAVVGALFYANLPTRWTIGTVGPTFNYLVDAKLKKIESEKDILTAKDTTVKDLLNGSPLLVMAVRRPGCTFCRREASTISGITEKLNAKGVRLIGVVHESLGVDEFRPYLKGDLYLDVEKRFYGPQERWLPIWQGFLRFSTYKNLYEAKKSGFKGNLAGEGRLLGGVYLLNKDKILFSHLEKEWGDQVDLNKLIPALNDL